MRLPPHEMNLEQRQADLIFRLFIDPADQDYLAARWAYSSGMFHSFYWNAAQAMEKLFKAAHLFQSRPIKSYRHDLNRLFADLRSNDNSHCFPPTLLLPDTTAMGTDAWEGKPTELFVDYLNSYGSTENRYGSIGTFINGPVIHLLDQLARSCREFIKQQNRLIPDMFNQMNLAAFESDRFHEPVGWVVAPDLLLERLYRRRYNVGENEMLRSVFASMNFAFFDEHLEPAQTFGGQHFTGSPLYNHLVRCRNFDGGKENNRRIDDLRDWVDESIPMSRSVRRALSL